jgi:hypothetical protein
MRKAKRERVSSSTANVSESRSPKESRLFGLDFWEILRLYFTELYRLKTELNVCLRTACDE